LVSVGGTANQYQWMKDGVNIPGANNNSYTIGPVDSSYAGSYLCRIINTIATELTLYSRPITVTVEGVVGVNEITKQIPKTFALYQNYPNPFNPSTTIKFTLPKAEELKIEVFNALSQKVAVLVNEKMPAGLHEVEFNAQDLPSGVYVYKITAGQYSDVNKMLYLK
jgi:hypothetical protein